MLGCVIHQPMACKTDGLLPSRFEGFARPRPPWTSYHVSGRSRGKMVPHIEEDWVVGLGMEDGMEERAWGGPEVPSIG